jgi:hypothetical protein
MRPESPDVPCLRHPRIDGGGEINIKKPCPPGFSYHQRETQRPPRYERVNYEETTVDTGRGNYIVGRSASFRNPHTRASSSSDKISQISFIFKFALTSFQRYHNTPYYILRSPKLCLSLPMRMVITVQRSKLRPEFASALPSLGWWTSRPTAGA